LSKPLRYFEPLRIRIFPALSCLLSFVLPLLIKAPIRTHSFYLVAYYILACLVVLYAIRRNQEAIYQLGLHSQDIREKNHLLQEENGREMNNQIALQEKIRRYDSLKKIIEDVNSTLSLENIADHIAEVAFSLVANNKGTCLLYVLDGTSQTGLTLFKAKKEDPQIVIKSKEGDIFDVWVSRHTTPLLVEDSKKDFRFDLDKVKSEETRRISSLISVPLMSGNSFLGVLRLDSYQPSYYTLDDLRFLSSLSDFGAVAIENGVLFQKTQDLAIHDELTGLYTKGYFLERLRDELKRSSRQERPCGVLMLDIDHFKKYNDKFGHTAGDIVLKRLAETITEQLKDISAVASRFGGEEFCVILSNTDKKKAKETAELIRKAVGGKEIVLRKQATKITVSIGVAAFPQDTLDAEELILRADKALYDAKQKGRNKVVAV
jgi:diguanylate cyclase (GGDEF)-like protein